MVKLNNQCITWSEALNTIISEDGSMKLKEFLDKYKISYPTEINYTEDSIVSLESQMLIDMALINNCHRPIFVNTVSYSTLNQYLMFMKMYFQENQLKIFEDKFKEVFEKWFNVQKDYSSNVFGVDNVFKDCLKYDEDDVVLDIEKLMKLILEVSLLEILLKLKHLIFLTMIFYLQDFLAKLSLMPASKKVLKIFEEHCSLM